MVGIYVLFSVACNCDVEGHKAVLNASHDYVDYYKADLFTQKGDGFIC